MTYHFLQGAKYLCGVKKPVHHATIMTFFRLEPKLRCPQCWMIWREQQRVTGLPAAGRPFDYDTFALEVAAALIAERIETTEPYVLDAAPSKAQARKALRKVIEELRKQAAARRAKPAAAA